MSHLSRGSNQNTSVEPPGYPKPNSEHPTHRTWCQQLFLQQEKFFTMRMVEPWSRLPKKVMDAPFLKVFKTR